MSAEVSTGFHESAESMALLGQHKQIPGPAAADATAVLAPNSGYVSQRLELFLPQCQGNSEIDREMWDDFEIRRRSVITYINQYLDCLQQVHKARSRHVYEIDELDDEASHTSTSAQAYWPQ
jgi:hypothetical protein